MAATSVETLTLLLTGALEKRSPFDEVAEGLQGFDTVDKGAGKGVSAQ